jgi:SAM-dependent methyltransferase
LNVPVSDLRDTNLVSHPFKDGVVPEFHDFGWRYFDDPDSRTGFGGYHKEHNGAEGRRDWEGEAAVVASVPGVQTVLDVGCAKGFFVETLRERGLEAWGVDISAYAVECAAPETRPYLSVMPILDVGQLGRSFDLVHVCGVFVYLTVPEIRASLLALHEVARVGAVFWEPSLEHLQRWWDAGDPGAIDPLRKQELPQAVWDALFAEAGFLRERGWYRRVHLSEGPPDGGNAPPTGRDP